MTPEMFDLARRAVICKGWRWMPGMRTTEGMRVIHEPRLWPDRPSAIREGSWVDTAVPRPLGDHLPDFDDPATMGCLLALVREAWRAPRALVRLSANGTSFHVFDVDRVTMGGNWAAFLCGDRGLQTEAGALVAALEAAPEVTP